MSSTISISMEIIDDKYDCDDDLMTSCSFDQYTPETGFGYFPCLPGTRNNARSSDLLPVDRCDERINHPESWYSHLRLKSSRKSKCVVHIDFEFSSEGERRGVAIHSRPRNRIAGRQQRASQSGLIPSFSDNPEASPSLPALSRSSPLLAT
jgi:hypothetical protein